MAVTSSRCRGGSDCRLHTLTQSERSARTRRRAFQRWMKPLPQGLVATYPNRGFRRSEVHFKVWRVLGSNQRRTTPTVLQNGHQTTLQLRQHPDTPRPDRLFARAAESWLSTAGHSWTPRLGL